MAAAVTAECYANMLEMKSRNRLAYCSGWTVEISAPACEKTEKRWRQRARSSTSSVHVEQHQTLGTPCRTSATERQWALRLFAATLSRATHPVFDSFCCMGRFLLGVVLSEYVNQAHEIDFLLRGSWDERQRTVRVVVLGLHRQYWIGKGLTEQSLRLKFPGKKLISKPLKL